MKNAIVRIYNFYRDGFAGMTSTGRSLWLIIAIKVFVMFAVLKLFFFPNTLETESSDRGIENSGVVRENLLQRTTVNDKAETDDKTVETAFPNPKDIKTQDERLVIDY